jgi:hypothetical protein
MRVVPQQWLKRLQFRDTWLALLRIKDNLLAN